MLEPGVETAVAYAASPAGSRGASTTVTDIRVADDSAPTTRAPGGRRGAKPTRRAAGDDAAAEPPSSTAATTTATAALALGRKILSSLQLILDQLEA